MDSNGQIIRNNSSPPPPEKLISGKELVEIKALKEKEINQKIVRCTQANICNKINT